MVAINSHNYFFFKLWKSVATVEIWVSNILQNIAFCAQQYKESHTGLEQLEDEMMTEFSKFFGISLRTYT